MRAGKFTNSSIGMSKPGSVVGAVDMGSKNFKFVFGRKLDGTVSTELIRKERLELGKEVTENNGLIRNEKIAEVKNSLSHFVDFCSEHGASDVLAITASAIRNARNYDRISEIALVLGVNLEFADGVREGEIGYFAATGGAPNKLVTEVGSRSMQISWEAGGDIRAFSAPVGYELAFESFIEHEASLRDSENRFRKFLDGNFGELPKNTDQYFALAFNTAASFIKGRIPVETETVLDREALEQTLARLRSLSAADYASLKSSLPKAEKILPGLIFLQYIMERTGHERMFASPNELPVGLITEHFLSR